MPTWVWVDGRTRRVPRLSDRSRARGSLAGGGHGLRSATRGRRVRCEPPFRSMRPMMNHHADLQPSRSALGFAARVTDRAAAE